MAQPPAEPDSASPWLPRPPPDRVAIEAALAQLRGQRVAVALSGGVDSAAAALALRRTGAEVVGLTLRLHDVDPQNPLAPRACCAPDDVQDARHVAEELDIPFYVVDARAPFEAGVVAPFVGAYLQGRTPNPCVGCNSFVKLGMLARRARALGCAKLATGHYARISIDEDGQPHLFSAVDDAKDQSYFLFGTPTRTLAELVFPLGALSKNEVRDLALDAGLPVAHKIESQEVCFVGGAGAGAYVMSRPEAAGDRSGVIVDEAGEQVGAHDGVARFTIGQRRGLGLGTHNKLYVLQIDGDGRRITVGGEEALNKRGLVAERVAWPAGKPALPARVVARIRHRDPGTPASISAIGDDRVEVAFDRPVKAVAPGQAVVFYAGEEVLGGAWIVEATA